MSRPLAGPRRRMRFAYGAPRRRFRPSIERLEAYRLLASFTVNVTGDAPDPDLTDNSPDTDLDASGIQCTLRSAIQNSNDRAGPDRIVFNLRGAGPHTIRPTSALPSITDAVVIDGTSQPGFAGTPVVELDGTVDGLRVTPGGKSVEIRGLVINRFAFQGIFAEGADGLVVAGNFIGTDVTGTVDLGNGSAGVYLAYTSDATIGGLPTGEPNVISGNEFDGVFIRDGSRNRILGNFIGTDVTGMADLGNGMNGIRVQSADNIIGGADAGARNVISGNGSVAAPGRNGILLDSANATGNLVEGNIIGLAVDGLTALGNFRSGVVINFGASSNTVRNNVLASNVESGVYLQHGGTAGNQVVGNTIGLNNEGEARGNGLDGVTIDDAPRNTIGGTDPDALNVISGNDHAGVRITGSSAEGNTVLGNLIGTADDGETDRGNSTEGVVIQSGASYNSIGGTTAAAVNIISGNDFAGVNLLDEGTTFNTVVGNFIGCDFTGTLDRGNARGVLIQAGASFNTIGGMTEGERNVISGNDAMGVLLSGGNTRGNLVQGNHVGTNSGGDSALGNAGDGVVIRDGASVNTIGGAEAGARNVISANGARGVLITGADTTDNKVLGNLIGLDQDGENAIPNGTDGVGIDDGAHRNTIGGDNALNADGSPRITAGNIIAGNENNGVLIQGSGTTSNWVQGNFIGTSRNGDAAIANARGIEVADGAERNEIGGTQATKRNVIAGNNGDGVLIRNAGNLGNSVVGNFIGTNARGLAKLPNKGDGVAIEGSPNNFIGGRSADSRNIISGNGFRGVSIVGTASKFNAILGNFIGINANGAGALGNATGGVLIDGASFNSVGGLSDRPGEAPGNVVSGSDDVLGSSGVIILGADAKNNTVQGNLIGTDVHGLNAKPNTGDGVSIFDGTENLIGGSDPKARNVISGNRKNGVFIGGGSKNRVEGNLIGVDRDGLDALGNGWNGVYLLVAPGNAIGGATALPGTGAGNVISGNGTAGLPLDSNGIRIDGACPGTTIAGNLIGTDAEGTGAVPNSLHGVLIRDGSGITIGGATTGGTPSNVISGNGKPGQLGPGTGDGIQISGPSATSNAVINNYIGLQLDGVSPLGNQTDGVLIDGSAGNMIGGATAADRNIISGNLSSGVEITGGTAATKNQVQGNWIGTDKNGAAAGGGGVGNRKAGVLLDNVPENMVGGPTTTPGSAPGNVISNNLHGIVIVGLGARLNVVLGNLIGLAADGSSSLGNRMDGVRIFNASDNTIGGILRTAGNVISANAGNGIQIANRDAMRNVVQSNFIGTDLAGNAGRGNSQAGVRIYDAPKNTIGGGPPGVVVSNVIAKNAVGVEVSGFGARENQVLRNRIGTSTGEDDLGNSGAGVVIKDNAGQNLVEENTIGFSPPGVELRGDNNMIRGNTVRKSFDGIRLYSGTGNTIKDNKVSDNSNTGIRLDGGKAIINDPNSLFGNGGLGIDLLGDGPTSNDPGDLDSGPNDLQNYPVLLAAKSSVKGTIVTGSLDSLPNTTFNLEFFANPHADPDGTFEGEVFLAFLDVTTGADGLASFTLFLPHTDLVGQFLTATASDLGRGVTSEFSPGLRIESTTLVTLAIGDSRIEEGSDGTSTLVFTVTLSAASSGPVTVTYATADGTATVADGDYLPAYGTLVLAPGGPLTRKVVVLVRGDTRFEPDEAFTVNLSNPSGATLADGRAVGLIRNDDAPVIPLITVDDGDPGFHVTGPDWLVRSGDGFRGDFRSNAIGRGNRSAQWRLTDPGSGRFAVFVTWVARPRNADRVTYQILEGDRVVRTAVVNQRLRPDSVFINGTWWQSLGVFARRGGALKVVLSDARGGEAIADAVFLAAASPQSVRRSAGAAIRATAASWRRGRFHP